jgi:hypothetical protein
MLQQTRVVFSPALKCFVDSQTGGRYRGITKLLKQTFWPAYNFKNAQTPGPVGVGNNRFVKGPTASKRGTLVDKQISEIISGHPATGKLHAFTSLAFKAMRAGNLTPVASQVVVFDPARRIATAVDILCRNSAGSYVVVELKCSSDFKYHASTGAMKHVFSQLDDSIANQQLVQTIVTRRLFERTYGKALAYILKINQRGAFWIPVPTPREDAIEEALTRMAGAHKKPRARTKQSSTGRLKQPR